MLQNPWVSTMTGLAIRDSFGAYEPEISWPEWIPTSLVFNCRELRPGRDKSPVMRSVTKTPTGAAIMYLVSVDMSVIENHSQRAWSSRRNIDGIFVYIHPVIGSKFNRYLRCNKKIEGSIELERKTHGNDTPWYYLVKAWTGGWRFM